MLFMKPFKFSVHVQVYVVDYDIMNTEMEESNVCMLISLEWELESDNIAEVNCFAFFFASIELIPPIIASHGSVQ